MGEYTAKLRRQIVRNQKLATEISNVLAKYQLEAPEGKIVVWGPSVVDAATSAFDLPRIWLEGIPAPDLLEAAYRIQDRFRL
jgi:hypothetical protein